MSRKIHKEADFWKRVDAYQEQLIREYLIRADYNRTAAARAAGIHRSYFYQLIKQYKIDEPIKGKRRHKIKLRSIAPSHSYRSAI